MLSSLQAIATGTSPVKIAHYQIAYKPFLSVFNMTDVAGSGLFPNPDVSEYFPVTGRLLIISALTSVGYRRLSVYLFYC